MTALDRNGLPATGYAGTVRLASSDGRAVLPNDYTFTAADAGAVTLFTQGGIPLTVTDPLAGITGSVLVVF